VISPDLVRVRRRGERLEIVQLKGPTRLEAERSCEEILSAVRAAAGKSEEEVEQLLLEIPRSPSAEKLFAGLCKVALDDCEFEAPLELDAVELRRVVFERAALRRKDPAEHGFVRAEILAEASRELGQAPELVERALFSDLKGARLLVRTPSVSAPELLSRYERGQVQGILLRAVRIGLDVVCTSPDAYRALFRKLKFRRLLHRIESRPGGAYHIEVDGPLCLFESVTKYGLALAQLVPALDECQEVRLSADLRWGGKRTPLKFEVVLGGQGQGHLASVRDEVQALLGAVNRPGTGWTARLGSELLDIPGVGIVVPDLALEDAAGHTVHVEVMGYWSREAVFRRLDWMSAQGQAGVGRAQTESAGSGKQRVRLLLAVSSQLRVSPDVLPPDANGGVYVYKGALVARALLEHARALVEAGA